MDKKIIIGVVVAVFVAGGGIWHLMGGSFSGQDSYGPQATNGDSMAESSPVKPQVFSSGSSLGVPVAFEWLVDETEGTLATHSAIHWGGPSDPREFGIDVGPKDATYAEFTKEYASGAFDLPRNFTTTIEFPEPGLYHYRFHALVGGLNFWSEEYSIVISQ